MRSKSKPDGVLVIALFLSDSNEDLVEKMRAMRQARTDPFYTNVVCCITGWDGEAADLWELPEIRAFCRRLMTVGFASYLDAATSIVPDAPPYIRAGFGALEVWLIAEGRFGAGLVRRMNEDRVFAKAVLSEWEVVLAEQNRIADAALGPIPG